MFGIFWARNFFLSPCHGKCFWRWRVKWRGVFWKDIPGSLFWNPVREYLLKTGFEEFFRETEKPDAISRKVFVIILIPRKPC